MSYTNEKETKDQQVTRLENDLKEYINVCKELRDENELLQSKMQSKLDKSKNHVNTLINSKITLRSKLDTAESNLKKADSLLGGYNEMIKKEKGLDKSYSPKTDIDIYFESRLVVQ